MKPDDDNDDDDDGEMDLIVKYAKTISDVNVLVAKRSCPETSGSYERDH